jgi:hypothetical protein
MLALAQGIAPGFCCAKGAISFPAWGIAPGIRLSMNAALKARFNVSIPDITLVEVDAVLAQQLAKFVLKSTRAMVLLLVPQRIAVRRQADSGSRKTRHTRAARKSRDTERQAP